MPGPPDESPNQRLSQILQQARDGDHDAEGRLLEVCRSYLRIHVQRQVQGKLAQRVDASDIVQQTLLDAWRALDGFRGSTSAELLAWLKQILEHNAIDVARRHLIAEKRCATREVPLYSQSSGGETTVQKVCLAAMEESPSECAAKSEEELMLAYAIAQLSPDYQEVIICRSLLGLPFADVAERMKRSRPAVQMLWARAVEQLRHELS